MLILTPLVAQAHERHSAGLRRSLSVLPAVCLHKQFCFLAAVPGKAQAGFSRGAKGRWETGSFSSCPQPAVKRSLSPAGSSHPVHESSCLWCLGGFIPSKCPWLVSLGKRGFGVQLDCTWGLHLGSQLCKVGAEAMEWVSLVPAAERWCTGTFFLRYSENWGGEG